MSALGDAREAVQMSDHLASRRSKEGIVLAHADETSALRDALRALIQHTSALERRIERLESRNRPLA